MIITATEFKTNLGKYLEMAASQDIFITKNGKSTAVSQAILSISVRSMPDFEKVTFRGVSYDSIWIIRVHNLVRVSRLAEITITDISRLHRVSSRYLNSCSGKFSYASYKFIKTKR